MQAGYAAMGQMGQPPAVADPYYYASYLPFQAADASAGAWPTGRDAAMYSAYAAPMTTDWTGRSVFGQYDYSWFPSFDYSTWSANAMAVPQNAAPQKGGRAEYVDPASGAYYEMDSSNSVGVNGSGVSNIEQGVKGMRVNAEEDGSEHNAAGAGYAASTRPSQAMPAPAKKSWANIASQPARPVGRSKIVPRAPVNIAKSDSGSSSSWESKTGPGQARGQPASVTYSASAGSAGSRTVTGSTEAAAVPAGGSWSSESTGSRMTPSQYLSLIHI